MKAVVKQPQQGQSRFARQFVNYDQEVTDRVICLVYGKFGSGKTHFGGTFPKPFLIDVERGGKTLAGQGVPGWQVPNSPGRAVWQPLIQLIDEIERRVPPFDQIETVIIDSLSELGELWFQEIIGWPESGVIEDKRGDASYDAYARLKQRFKSFVRRVKDLGLHAVFTSGVQMEKEEGTGTWVAEPKILGGYRNEIGHDFDEVYYMEAAGTPGKPEWKAHVTNYRFFPAKSRSDIKAPITNPDYSQLLQYYRSVKTDAQ